MTPDFSDIDPVFRQRERQKMPQDESVDWKKTIKVIILCVVALAIFIGLIVAGAAGCKAYNRYQARQDAANLVKVTHTLIQNEAQKVDVEKQLAKQKVAEAQGIRKAQDIINATLTPLYVQHEAIQAQEAMVNSPSHSEIYIPSGNNGVPLVKTLNNK